MHKIHEKSRAAWELVCERCGRCCYEKIDFDGTIYYTDIPCEHLDPESRHCRVYTDRFRVCKGCIELTPDTLGQGFLPADCPYVANLKDYRAPVLSVDDPS